MNGLYVIIIVVIVAIFYAWKYFYSPQLKSIKNNELEKNWKKIGSLYKWTSIGLCIIANFLLKREIIIASRLKGSALAQADFGVFWVFVAYIIPTIILVIFLSFLHLKYKLKRSPFSFKVLSDPFLICAVIVILFPLYFLWFR